MYGNIDRLLKNDYGSTTYGFIFGEDGNQYFFHKSSLINCTIYQIEEGDSVEFDPQPSVPTKRNSAINVRKRSSSSPSSEISTVNPGMNPNIHLEHLNSEEKKIANLLSKTLYVTNGGNTVYINECMYKYILIKPTTNFSTLFRLTREIVVIFFRLCKF